MTNAGLLLARSKGNGLCITNWTRVVQRSCALTRLGHINHEVGHGPGAFVGLFKGNNVDKIVVELIQTKR